MRRRLLFVAAAMAAITVGAVAAIGPAGGQQLDPPNIVMFYTDDQTVADLQFMPNVRAFFDGEGTSYSNAFVSLSLCCPARVAIATGQHPQNNGVWANNGPLGGYDEHAATTALPVWLSNAGYHTTHIGKSMHGVGRTVPPGWDDYRDPHPSDSKQFDWSLSNNGVLQSFNGSTNADYATYVLADMAAEVVTEQAAGGPFFLKFTTSAPHVAGGGGPPVPAPEHDGLYRHLSLPRKASFNSTGELTAADIRDLGKHYRRRAESLASADVSFQRIVDALAATGELANTVVVFTTDNGFLLGEHGQRGKVSYWDESLRVPLLIRGPGFGNGVIDSRPTQNIDLPVTFAEIAGATPLVTVDGVSILSGLDNDRVLYHVGKRQELSDNWWQAINTSRFVYVTYARGSFERLFDLETDPYQLNDLSTSADHDRLKAAMVDLHQRLFDCAGPGCFVTADNDVLADMIGSPTSTTTTTAPSTTTTVAGQGIIVGSVTERRPDRPGFTIAEDGTVTIQPLIGATRYQVRYKPAGGKWSRFPGDTELSYHPTMSPGEWVVAVRAYRARVWRDWAPVTVQIP